MLSQLSYTPTLVLFCFRLNSFPYLPFFQGSRKANYMSFLGKRNNNEAIRLLLQATKPISVVCCDVVGLSGLEPPTSRLSGVRSNHLSYKPVALLYSSFKFLLGTSKLNSAVSFVTFLSFLLLRKEVIQPHLPIRLPCYDFTLIINPTFGSVLLR